MLGQFSRRTAEKLIHAGGDRQIIGRNVIPYVRAILLCPRCPDDPHTPFVALARRAAIQLNFIIRLPLAGTIDNRTNSTSQ